MLDNVLIPLMVSTLKASLAQIGAGPFEIEQSNQPTQQGTPTAPTIFFTKMFDRRIGQPAKTDVWVGDTVATVTGSIDSTGILTVSNVGTGTLFVGQTLAGVGINPGTMWITKMLTGTGGTGTYQLNQGFTLPSQIINFIAGMVHTEKQQYASPFKMTALSVQDPANATQLTASDIVNYACAAMQSDNTIMTLKAQDVGILNVDQVQNPYFTDDRDQFEASPSFDFTLTHKQITMTTTPILQTETFQVLRV